MTFASWRSRHRVPIVAAACAVAVGLGACGGSGDDEESASASGDDRPQILDPKGVTLEDTRSGSDTDQIVATLHYMPVVLRSERSEEFCAKLTPAGKQELADFFKDSMPNGTCAMAARRVARIGKRTAPGPRPAVKVYDVEVKGDRATVDTQGGVVGSSRFTMNLVKRDGEWKLPVSAFRTGG
jgi:hypothetical protein